ncbi:hypothetical protein QQF64_034903 [Cirrhinus molitorella]|uniref:Myotrophin n=1 Tax=Cirrhinus molitorella TaxID=172907 RepID=A0ABR3NE90_9TELE
MRPAKALRGPRELKPPHIITAAAQAAATRLMGGEQLLSWALPAFARLTLQFRRIPSVSDHKLSVKSEKHPEPGDMGDKELMWALKNGDLDEVKGLLVKAEDVNRTLEGGRKPLHYAADCGQTEMLEFLLSKGADVNAPDKHGITPLLSATYEGHVSCVKILLEKGADKERKGPDGLSAFEAAESEAIRDLLKVRSILPEKCSLGNRCLLDFY